MKEQKITSFKKIDWSIVFIYLGLSLFGVANIYSTQGDTQELFDFSKKHGAQLLWMSISFAVAIIIMIFSSRFFSVFAYHIYIVALALLLLTLVIGLEVKSSKSWLSFGGLRFQPSELAKFATAMALARLFGSREFKYSDLPNRLKSYALILLPAGLILLQRDWGSALVFMAFLPVLYRQGMSGWVLVFIAFITALFISTLLLSLLWITTAISAISLAVFFFENAGNYKSTLQRVVMPGLLFIGIGIVWKLVSGNEIGYDKILVASVILVLLGSFLWMVIKGKRLKIYGALFFMLSSLMIYSADHIYHNVIKSHHRDRIEDMLGIKVDIKDAGYNVYQSKVAIGSGGLTGKGFMQGTQTKLNFVPEQSTDFIFCTIGEEWGFRGTFVVILMFAVMLIRLITLAERQKTVFSRMYGYGVAMIILFHFTINIGMTIGLAPVVGIPLPYMSAGGSSLLSFTILLFVFLKLDSSD